jgi:hypothetical protein
MNAVTDWRDRVVGYRCRECGGVYQSMWSDTCNGCREKERRHQELLAAIRARETSSADNRVTSSKIVAHTP